jgi:hypothetical protein
MNQKIENLIEKYLDIVHSPKNAKRRHFWQDPHHWNRDMWRGVPIRRTANDPVPFTIALDNSLWTHVLGFSLVDFYRDPELFLEVQLKKQIYSFENFDDYTYYTDELFIWIGVITEHSFLGAQSSVSHKEGWIKDHLLKSPEDLYSLSFPNFQKVGYAVDPPILRCSFLPFKGAS